jgi:hypothetical protein
MPFLRTTLATDFAEPSNWRERLTDVNTANPNYRGKYHLVHAWLIEFDAEGLPWREIGLDEHGDVVLAGPSKTDYGFWHDTNMQYPDFAGEPITEEHFESMWAMSGVVTP